MGIGPKNAVRQNVYTCTHCRQEKPESSFTPTRSPFYLNGRVPMCVDCINNWLTKHDWNWKYVDKLCQYINVPFIPKEWEKIKSITPKDAFVRYCTIFQDQEFDEFGWEDYYNEFVRLRESGELEDQLPILSDKKRNELIQKWDGAYSDEDFKRLEDLLEGMMLTQNINTHLQMDQALKLCKISLVIDSAIREGENIDKLLSSYEKLVKIANFTPKNSKNASDLESVGELFNWLEAGGWKNRFYDGTTRDVIDELQKNIQSWNQRIYINETGIGEDISRRLEALQQVNKAEKSYYNLNEDFDLDQHEVDGYNELLSDEPIEEEFAVDLEGGEN